MSPNIQMVLEVVLLAGGILVVFNLLRKYVLHKVKVNKWIVLALAVIAFFVPVIFNLQNKGTIWNLLLSGIFVVLFLWFLDLTGFTGKRIPKNENKYVIGSKKVTAANDNIVIKPKAKPNRVKNKQGLEDRKK